VAIWLAGLIFYGFILYNKYSADLQKKFDFHPVAEFAMIFYP